MAARTTRGIPTITKEAVADTDKLHKYIQRLEHQVKELAQQANRAELKADNPPEPDFDRIRQELSKDGRHTLNIEGLPGSTSRPQAPTLKDLVFTADPPVQNYDIGTVIVVTGAPNRLKRLEPGTPPTWVTLITSV